MHDRRVGSLKKMWSLKPSKSQAGATLPPSNCIFIIATSVFNDIPALIRSRREREEKLSWAKATSRLLPNCRMCSLSLLRIYSRFVCNQFVTWSQCASRSNGRRCSRSTTSLQFSLGHNCRCSYPGLCPWAEVRKDVSWFLFIF